MSTDCLQISLRCEQLKLFRFLVVRNENLQARTSLFCTETFVTLFHQWFHSLRVF